MLFETRQIQNVSLEKCFSPRCFLDTSHYKTGMKNEYNIDMRRRE